MVKLELSINLGKRSKRAGQHVESVSQNTYTDETRPAVQARPQIRRLKKRRSKARTTLVILGMAMLFSCGGYSVYRWKFVTPAVVDPFTPKIAASMQFPLYYPTTLPTGYKIDPKSTTAPQAGVVVFTLVGPNKGKIFCSEEARPNTFNLGGFYATFKSMKQMPVSDGAIATGYLYGGSTTVASRANNKTWILCNTTAKVPATSLGDMLKSIIPNS